MKQKEFPIEQCCRIAYARYVPDSVQVQHVQNVSMCQFVTPKGVIWQFCYDHVTESFILMCGRKTLPVRHQRQLFDYLNSNYYDKN